MPIRRTKSGEPYLDPGQRRAPITFLEQQDVSDVSGTATSYVVGTPPDVTLAEILSVSGTDLIKSGQTVSEVKIVAVIAYKAPGRSSTERFQDARGNTYIVQAVRDIDPGRLVFQELTCLLLGAAS